MEYFVCIPARLANGASLQTAECPIAGTLYSARAASRVLDVPKESGVYVF
jgi:hypothetical protein